MTERTSLGNAFSSQSEKIIQKIAKTVDLNKLVKDKNFLSKLQNLSPAEQLEVFNRYKDQFTELSQDPQSAIAKWTGNLTQTFPNTDAIRKSVDYGMQLFQDVSHSLGQNTPRSSK